METINIWGELSEATDANNCPDKHVRNAILSTSDRTKIIEDSNKAIVFDEKKKMESNNSGFVPIATSSCFLKSLPYIAKKN